MFISIDFMIIRGNYFISYILRHFIKAAYLHSNRAAWLRCSCLFIEDLILTYYRFYKLGPIIEEVNYSSELTLSCLFQNDYMI